MRTNDVLLVVLGVAVLLVVAVVKRVGGEAQPAAKEAETTQTGWS